MFNTDEAAKGNPRKVGVDGIIQEPRAKWLIGFAEGEGIFTSMRPALLAVLH